MAGKLSPGRARAAPRAFAVHPGVEQSVGQLRCYCYRPGDYRLSHANHGNGTRSLVRGGILL